MNNDLNEFLNAFWIVGFFILLCLAIVGLVVFFCIFLPTLAIGYVANYIYARYSYARDRKAALTKLGERKKAVDKCFYPSWLKIKILTCIRKGYEDGIEAAREKRWEAARKKGIAERKKPK